MAICCKENSQIILTRRTSPVFVAETARLGIRVPLSEKAVNDIPDVSRKTHKRNIPENAVFIHEGKVTGENSQSKIDVTGKDSLFWIDRDVACTYLPKTSRALGLMRR